LESWLRYIERELWEGMILLWLHIPLNICHCGWKAMGSTFGFARLVGADLEKVEDCLIKGFVNWLQDFVGVFVW